MPAFSLPYFALKLPQPVFFVQIGAMDGVSHDPIHEMVKSQNWSGLLVEPVKEHFEKLKENYSGCTGLIFENSAVASHTGTATLYHIPSKTVHERNLPRWTLEASSFYKDKNALDWNEVKQYVIEEKVPCLKLSDLLAKHNVKKIDLLQIDAEGYDAQILRQLNFEKFNPKIIYIEIVNMTRAELAECKQLLDRHDYLYSKFGYNLLAIKQMTF